MEQFPVRKLIEGLVFGKCASIKIPAEGDFDKKVVTLDDARQIVDDIDMMLNEGYCASELVQSRQKDNK